jgi:hypothetical protein
MACGTGVKQNVHALLYVEVARLKTCYSRFARKYSGLFLVINNPVDVA